MTIIGDLKKLKAAIPHQNLNRSGTSIDRILNKLLQSMHRSDNNLPGSDFIYHIGIQGLNSKIRELSRGHGSVRVSPVFFSVDLTAEQRRKKTS